MEDAKIIDLYWKRDENAIAETDYKYGCFCHTIAIRLLGVREDAEECVNDAYLGAWNTIPPARPKPLLTYLCKIVRNISLKVYHRNDALKRSSNYTIAMQEIEGCITDQKTIEEEIAMKELSRMIETFLDTLPTKDRVIFMRRYAYLDHYADIAKQVGMSEKNISVRLTRIRHKLKQYLVEKGVFI